jgi:uncharacterized membrane protein YccC
MAKRNDKAKGGADAAEGGIRLSAHPRARRTIRLAKGWGGLATFVLVLLLSAQAGVPAADALVRAIVGGFVGYVVAWAMAVTVWRHVAVAEIEQTRRRLIAAAEEAEEAEAAAEAGREQRAA